jgi:hypothetical protein
MSKSLSEIQSDRRKERDKRIAQRRGEEKFTTKGSDMKLIEDVKKEEK